MLFDRRKSIKNYILRMPGDINKTPNELCTTHAGGQKNAHESARAYAPLLSMPDGLLHIAVYV